MRLITDWDNRGLTLEELQEETALWIDMMAKYLEVIESRAQIDPEDDEKELRRQLTHIRSRARAALSTVRDISDHTS